MKTRYALLVLLLICLLGLSSQAVFAQGSSLNLVKSVQDTQPGNVVDVNQEFTYTVSIGCTGVGISTPCENIVITDNLPPELEFVEVIVPSPPSIFSGSYDGAGTVTITATQLDRGTSFNATIRVRVRPDAYDPLGNNDLDNFVTGTFDDTPDTYTSNTVTVTVEEPVPSWQLEKVRIVPAIEPTVDTNVTYRVRLCPVGQVGNIGLDNLVISDTLPPGAVFVSAPPDGVHAGGVVTWNIGNIDLMGGCVTRLVTIRYESPPFSIGDTITNSAGATANNPINGVGVGIGPADITHDIINPVPNPTTGKSISGSPVGVSGIGRWRLNLNSNNANVDMPNVVMTDLLPEELQILVISSGTWTFPDGYAVRATVQYILHGDDPNNPANWVTLGTVDGSSSVNFNAPNANLRGARWVFVYDDPTNGTTNNPGIPLGFSTSTQPEIRFTPRTVPGPLGLATANTTPPNNVYTNCVVTTWGAASSQQSCQNVTITSDNVHVEPSKSRISGGAELQPLDIVTYELRLRVTERSTEALRDPIITDVLPSNFQFLEVLEILYQGNGVPAITPPPGSLPTQSVSGGPGGETLVFNWTGWTLNPPDTGSYDIIVRYSVQVRALTPQGGYTNTANFSNANPIICEAGTPGPGNSCELAQTSSVRAAVVFSAQKWIANPDVPGFVHQDTLQPDPACPVHTSVVAAPGESFTRIPCVSQGFPHNPNNPSAESDFFYELLVRNDGNDPAVNFVLYDILPHINDTGTLQVTVNRESEFQPFMTGPVRFDTALMAALGIAPGNITIEYNLTTNPCRDVLFNNNNQYTAPPGCNNVWTTTPADWAAVRSFRVSISAPIPVGATVYFAVDMRIPQTAQSAQIAWNSFARHANGQNSGPITAEEPPKVGIVVPHRYSIGNRVWFDANNNRIDPPDAVNEPGIAGVLVELYDTANNLIATTTTDNRGYYLFDNLDAGSYYVRVHPGNFAAGQPLEDMISSVGVHPNVRTDRRDKGIDDLNHLVNGIRSHSITLGPGAGNAPTGEPDIPSVLFNNLPGDALFDYGPFGRGTHGEADANSDLTLDFGFFIPMSIGNRVWRDDGNGDNAFRNDGVQNNGEAGIPGVRVELYRDVNGDGIPVPGGFVGFTTTGANGYYLFDTLTQGDYIVVIPTSNFVPGQPLHYHFNSDGVNNPNLPATLDENDKGIDGDFPAADGVRSQVITLVINSMPTGEDLGPGQHGSNVIDLNSNLTIDFGFYIPPLSLGNHIWHDVNNNGLRDPGEVGIGGVEVSLYLDTNNDGVPDGPAIATTTTDADGFYLFEDLPPGRYIVGVDASNFQPGGPLLNYGSSVPTFADNVDDNDNGINSPSPAASGILSNSVLLEPSGAPTGEAFLGDPALYGPFSRGSNGEKDVNSDLTIDFGFFIPMSIGNRVWLDSGAGGGVYNNGIQDGSEPGIAGATVTLWLDNGDGVFSTSTDTLVATTTTDANGYYLFDGLIEGDYFVYLPPANFQGGGALVNYDSSYDGTGANLPDNGVDRNDNGIDENLPATTGIRSVLIELRNNTEVTGETDLSGNPAHGPSSRGMNGESDNNSDLTIDFGFVEPRFSLGNRVWFDLNNNGLREPTEAPVPGVVVRLYNATGQNPDGSGIPATALNNPLRTTTTDAEGYYLFDDLPAGDYVIWIDADNFRSTGPLFEYYSSTGAYGDPTVNNTRDDDRDNGVDNTNPVVNGIFSHMVTLAKNSEVIGEADLSNNDAHGPAGERRGNQGQLDSNSNLTIDFGFYKPMSIGNRVWLDADNDGLITPGESGIAGVTVELYRDSNNDGTFDEFLGFRLTDANGYYLFDNLVPGTYQVVIPQGNFAAGQPLNNLNSTVDDVDVPDPSQRNRIDNNDNGIGTGTNMDIVSGPVVLVLDSEPTDETDIGPQGLGANGETNRNSNLTIDFGFTGQLMSLGNRVWFDPDNNGLLDAGENGIANVTVSLYRDSNNDGIPDGPAIATTTTDATGHYLFDALAPGSYIVGLNNSNFTGGQPLNGLISSTGAYSDPVIFDGVNFVRDDSRDNGLDALHPTFGLISSTVVLVRDQAPVGETDIGPQGIGANGSDANSNLTIDFGLYRPLSLGNRLWYDLNDNGLQDPTETGVPGAVVELYRDINGDGIPVPGGLVGTTTTDANGYYLFDGLGSGDYIVLVAPQNFQPGNVLAGLDNSTPSFNNAADRNNNGIRNPDPADNPVDGIRSYVVTLTPGSAPLGETDLSGNPAHGPNSRGNNGETDANSNLTIDFGFVPTTSMSLGNRVWIDEGAGGGVYRDGLRQPGEPGVDGVVVNLYLDTNGDGVPDGPAIATTTTSGGGYYLFDNLTPGSYLVQLAPSNFTGAGVLNGYGSTAVGTPGVDDNNNGLPNSSPEINGIFSDTVVLVQDAAPVGETDIGPQGTGAGGSDANSNLTVDFGLFRPMSIGNRVWFDNGPGAQTNNGLQDAGEPGIAGVLVELYEDINGDGSINPAGFVASRSTDANGYYLFDGLAPGSYIVYIPPANFTGIGPLVGLSNSDLEDGTITVDRNDNGINDPNPELNGIRSNVVNLTLGAQPTNETDLSGNAVLDGPNSRGRNGEANNNSNLTIDFGFYTADVNLMSLGNRVWLDDGAGGGGYNNGIQDGTEAGIPGVTVQLFRAVGGLPTTLVATTTTNAGGYYLFENLAPGNYIVVIPPANFSTAAAPLFGLLSSTGSYNNDPALGAARDDMRDNGIDNPSPGTNGIRSGVIQLVPGNEPLAEDVGSLPTSAADANSNLTVDFGFVPLFDLGDAPETGSFANGNPYNYNTTLANNGPQHRIISTLYMGSIVDAENDGQPSAGADGDDTGGLDDEDGVSFPPLRADTPADVEVIVFNNTGSPAYLIGWIDFDGSGTFDAGEAVVVTVPSSPTPQAVTLPFYVPVGADTLAATNGTTYARFRLTTDTSVFVGGSPANDPLPTGLASDGEVEDYLVNILPPGVSIDKTDGQVSIVVGQPTTYTVTIRNSASGLPVVNRTFTDNLPPQFLPGSITWTCTANALASCISGQPGGTGANGTGSINMNLDLSSGGQIVFSITATLDPTLIPPPDQVINTAIFGPDSAQDVNGIIFDPPAGTKVGTLLGDDVIRWTMAWFNTGPTSAATITDPLPANQTFLGNLVCTPFGTTVTNTCSYDAVTRTVIWQGTIGTGGANRLEIAFDVTVPGPGTYTNTATLRLNGRTVTAPASVNIPSGALSPSAPTPGQDDPVIVKLVDPQFIQPGELATWTITLHNPHGYAMTGLGFTDQMPAQLEIVSTTASDGLVTVTGQQVNFSIAALQPGQTVTVQIVTRLRPDVTPPLIVSNLVVLDAPYTGESSATLSGVFQLPATGETPLWRGWLVLLGGGLLLGAGLLALRRRRA